MEIINTFKQSIAKLFFMEIINTFKQSIAKLPIKFIYLTKLVFKEKL
jgi:hypothetical protein